MADGYMDQQQPQVSNTGYDWNAAGARAIGLGDLDGYFKFPQQDIIPKDNRFDLGGAAKGFASVAGGIGGLAEAWYGMQGLKLAKEQLGTQNAQWEKNYEAQRDDIAVSRAEREGARARSKEKFVVA